MVNGVAGGGVDRAPQSRSPHPPTALSPKAAALARSLAMPAFIVDTCEGCRGREGIHPGLSGLPSQTPGSLSVLARRLYRRARLGQTSRPSHASNGSIKPRHTQELMRSDAQPGERRQNFSGGRVWVLRGSVGRGPQDGSRRPRQARAEPGGAQTPGPVASAGRIAQLGHYPVIDLSASCPPARARHARQSL